MELSETSSPSVLVVIVNYRTPRLTIDCLASLATEADSLPNLRVVVVDNASGDDSLAQIDHAIQIDGRDRWASLVGAPRNHGFAAGNNVAIMPAFSAPNPPDYVLLLNPDTVVKPGAVTSLVEFLEENPRVGIAGSRLEDPDGTPQRSAFRFPSVPGEFEQGLKLGIVSRLLRQWTVAPPVPADRCGVDWVAGASMLVRRAVFEQIGPLDPGYFMYFEEVDFCRRAKKAGWECWYLPQARVVHLVGRSSGVTDPRHRTRRRPAYWFVSRRRYFVRHHGRISTAVADLAWASGFTLHRMRSFIRRKPKSEPARLLRDFLRHSVAQSLVGGGMGMYACPCANDPNMGTPTCPRHPNVATPAAGARNMNPAGISLPALLAEDLRTHDRDLFEQGFWAIAVHRFGNWRMQIHPRPFRFPFTLLYRFLFKWVQWTCGITLPYTTQVGRRVRIWHHGGMILHARSIGNDVHLRQNTTLGIARRDRVGELPTIGDRADIGCGACILGAIAVGHDAVIGANSVVLHDVPPQCLAVGAPARVVETPNIGGPQRAQRNTEITETRPKHERVSVISSFLCALCGRLPTSPGKESSLTAVR